MCENPSSYHDNCHGPLSSVPGSWQQVLYLPFNRTGSHSPTRASTSAHLPLLRGRPSIVNPKCNCHEPASNPVCLIRDSGWSPNPLMCQYTEPDPASHVLSFFSKWYLLYLASQQYQAPCGFRHTESPSCFSPLGSYELVHLVACSIFKFHLKHLWPRKPQMTLTLLLCALKISCTYISPWTITVGCSFICHPSSPLSLKLSAGTQLWEHWISLQGLEG